MLQEVYRLCAAGAGSAMDDDLSAGIQFIHALRQIVQRNQIAAEVADLVFVRLAHVERTKSSLRQDAALILLLDFRNAVATGFSSPRIPQNSL